MKLFDFFKKKRSKFKPPVYTDDSYIKAKLVYNNGRCFGQNLIILISYTANFTQDILEFCMACRDLNIIVRQSSGYIEQKNDDESSLFIPFNYILLSAHADRYIQLPEVLPLSNLTFNEIIPILYKTIEFKTIELTRVIKDNIGFDRKRFVYDKSLTNESVKYDDKFSYDDILYIKKNVPSSFHLIDMLYICNIYTKTSKTNLATFIKIHVPRLNDPIETVAFKKLFDVIYGKLTERYSINEIYEYVTTPLYLREDKDDEDDDGYLPTDEVDELFQRHYDTFSSVLTDEIIYEDIDDTINDESDT